MAAGCATKPSGTSACLWRQPSASCWGGVEENPLNRTAQHAVPLKPKGLFPFRKKSKSRYSELSFEKSIHPLKFTDSRSQIVPPLAGSQVTALYNPSLNNIHHDKWRHNSDIHNQSLL